MSTMTPTSVVLLGAVKLLEAGCCFSSYGAIGKKSVGLEEALENADRLTRMCAVTAIYIAAFDLVAEGEAQELADATFARLVQHLKLTDTDIDDDETSVYQWFDRTRNTRRIIGKIRHSAMAPAS